MFRDHTYHRQKSGEIVTLDCSSPCSSDVTDMCGGLFPLRSLSADMMLELIWAFCLGLLVRSVTTWMAMDRCIICNRLIYNCRYEGLGGV